YFFSVFQPLSIVLTACFSFAFDVVLLPLLSLVFLLSPFVKLTFLNGLFVFLEQIIKVTKGMIGAPLVFGKPHLAILLLFFLILGILYDVYRRKKLALFLLAVVALLFFQTKHPLENEVTVVDVGQGDSLFLRDVTGKTLLIDVGGKVVFGKPHLAILLLFFLILGILYDVYRRKKLALFLLAVVALLFFQTKHPLENEVTVVDVGQGDSLFLRDVTGKTLLIDVGGKVGFGKKEAWQECFR